MALSTQIKLLGSVREFLLEEGKILLPSSSEPKPSFPQEADRGTRLPRHTPEETGVESHMLEDFLRTLSATQDSNIHSLLILRNGAVICEANFAPYSNSIWHVCHSVSKSLIGTAVGIAMREGLFDIHDPLIQYYGNQMGLWGRMRMKSMTVRHLLNMTSGIGFNELSEMLEPDWIKGIFSTSLLHEPGSQFAYNSMNSFLLADLITRTSGETLTDYLRPRLFEPLGFGPISWEKSPSGVEKGGWGLYAMPEDMAKLGQLYLNKGRWSIHGADFQVLPESWVQEATQLQASNETDGYGYQMWVDPETGYPTMNGMFGQYVALIPPLNICIVMTAGCPRLLQQSPTFQLIRQFFYAISSLPAALPANPSALAKLQHTCSSLHYKKPAALPVPPALPCRKTGLLRGARWNSRPLRRHAPPEAWLPFTGITWRFSQNRAGLLPLIVQAMNNNFSSGVSALRLERAKDDLMLFWEEGEATQCLPVGLGRHRSGQIRMGEEFFLTACLAEVRCNEEGEPVLCIELCLTEHSSSRLIKLKLSGENLQLRLDESPQIGAALEIALNRKGEGIAEMAGASPGLGNIILGNDFVHYRISQLCTPEITGLPL